MAQDTIVTDSGKIVIYRDENPKYTKGDSALFLNELSKAIYFYMKENDSLRKNYGSNKDDKYNLMLNNYNIVVTYSLLGDFDSAYNYLKKALDIEYSYYALIDPDMLLILNDQKYNSLKDSLMAFFISQNKEIENYDLALQLMRLGQLDQYYRRSYQFYFDKFGIKSRQADSIIKLQDKIDSTTFEKFEEIVINKGWPKLSVVGAEASMAAFLIVQHSALSVLEKYKTIIKPLVKEGEFYRSNYAMLVDRILMYHKRKQIYGTQLEYNESNNKWELYPVKNKSRLNEIRKKMELGTIEDYLLQFGIDYDNSSK